MLVGDERSAVAAPRPPRAMALVLLFASAATILLVGIAGTAIAVTGLAQWPIPGRRAVTALLAASALTIVSLMLRGLRWIFLLRRAGVRIPIRDAYIGYFAGLSLLFVPFLIGEIAVRAYIHRVRGGVPVSTTIVVNFWDRLLDLVALGVIVGSIGVATSTVNVWTLGLLAIGIVTLIASMRGWFLPAPKAWLTALGTSVAAWILPGVSFWAIVSVWGYPYDLARAEYDYASSSSLGGIFLAPGGILIAGTRLLDALESQGIPVAPAVLSVVGVRVATVGVATILGGIFLMLHIRSDRPASSSHFDALADVYDVQIPQARREALLARKTDLMRQSLERLRVGRQGLDIGCGQGWYVARMRELGFNVTGIDSSPRQLAAAMGRIEPGGVHFGSVLDIPAPDASYDFAYAINVLHHLPSVDDQRRAFAEILRVLRPGGVLFVHEINTRNLLFRFYMGYIFPSLNCIDEGIERWLLPDEMLVYTDAPVDDIQYFTFLPEFLPVAVVRLLAPVERVLEASRLRVYSAHYLAVLRKPR
jgi:ubiquinone/menaquinone biosynthesis C-methylase UbiE